MSTTNYRNRFFTAVAENNLTDKEITLLKVLFNTPHRRYEYPGGVEITVLDQYGGDYAMCYFNYEDYANKTGFTQNQIKGIVGSLVKKNLVWTGYDPDGFGSDNEETYWIQLDGFIGKYPDAKPCGVELGDETYNEIQSYLETV